MKTSLLKYAISILVFALVVSQVDFDILLHETAQSSLKLLVFSALAITGQIFFLSVRWHLLLNAGRARVNFLTSLFINLAGFFANVLFITSVGGIIAKSGLAIRNGIPVVHAIFATFLDRFMTLAALLIFSIIGLPFLFNILDQRVITMLSVCILSCGGMIVLGLLLLRSGLLKNFILSNRKRARMAAALRHFSDNPILIAKVTLHSLAAQACFILSVYILSIDMNYNGTVWEFLAILPVIALISSLPISFGGWGIREGAFIYGLGLIGFSMESAFLLSVQVGVVTLITPFLVSLPCIFNHDLKLLSRNMMKTPQP